jgi:predicted permease
MSGFKRRAQSLLGLSEREDVDKELEFHIDERVRQLMRTGSAESEARAHAERELGSVGEISAACVEITRGMRRAERRATRVETARDDVTHGMRWLRRRPGAAAAVILVSALAVAAAEATSGLVWSTLLRPLALPAAEQVVAVHTIDGRIDGAPRRGSSSPADVSDWRGLTSFTATSSLNLSPVTIYLGDEPQRIMAVLVSQDIGKVLGVQPALGRMFTNEDHIAGAGPVVMLTNEYWRRAFGADSSIIGRMLRFGPGSAEVVGVLPSLPRLAPDREGEIWAPFDLGENLNRGATWLRVVGRLQSSATNEGAQLELNAMMARLARDEARTNARRSAWLEPLGSSLTHTSRPVLIIIALAIALVVLIACGNVAALLLAVSADRQSEIAVRAALGAAPWRLRRQFLAESLMCCGIGGALGLAMGPAAVRAFLSVYPGGLPRADEVALDMPAIGGGLLLAGALALLGALPLRRRVRSLNVATALLSGARHTNDRDAERFRTALVAAQVAFCTTLLIGGVLLVRVYRQLTATPVGFDAEQLVAFNVTPPATRYSTQADYLNFYDVLLERTQAVPGVMTASYTSLLPFDRENFSDGLFPDGVPQTPENMRFILYQKVEPSYTRVLGLPLLAGRQLNDRDREGAPRVGVINETLARSMFGAENPLGRKIGTGDRWIEVVGVVGSKRHRDLNQEPLLELFVPRRQESMGRSMWIVVRTSEPPALMLSRLRDLLRQVDPNIAFANAAVMSERVAQSIAPQRFRSLLLATLAGMALLLSTVGIWSLTSYNVSRQTRETGIRMALGMQPARALSRVLQRAVAIAASGVAGGVAVALVSVRTVDTQLFGVPRIDTATIVGVAAFLILITAAAALRPAWRASATDPLDAMRST